MKLTKPIITSVALAAASLAATPVFAQSTDWSGFYIGAEIGGANFQASPGGGSIDNSDVIGGLIAGYDHDLGAWVVGGGVDVDFSHVSLAGASLDRIWRLRARGGYKIGNGLLYATGGYANIEIGPFGDDSGYFIGGGYEFLIGSNFSVGGEVLYHKVNNFTGGGGTDIEVITYQIRGAYRF